MFQRAENEAALFCAELGATAVSARDGLYRGPDAVRSGPVGLLQPMASAPEFGAAGAVSGIDSA